MGKNVLLSKPIKRYLTYIEKIRNVDLSIECHLKLFDHTVLLILTYSVRFGALVTYQV